MKNKSDREQIFKGITHGKIIVESYVRMFQL